MAWSFWILAAVLLLTMEILTPGVFFFACVGLGALIAGLADLLNPPFWVPLTGFILVSVLSIYFIRPLAVRLFAAGRQKSNVDALVGKTAVVTQAIRPHEPGMVKVDGELWRAQSDETIEEHNVVTISAVTGTRLEVKRLLQ